MAPMSSGMLPTGDLTQRSPALAGLKFGGNHRTCGTGRQTRDKPPPSRLRCDGDHKNALFLRVLQKMSTFMTGETRGRRSLEPPAYQRVWQTEHTAEAIQERSGRGGNCLKG